MTKIKLLGDTPGGMSMNKYKDRRRLQSIRILIPCSFPCPVAVITKLIDTRFNTIELWTHIHVFRSCNRTHRPQIQFGTLEYLHVMGLLHTYEKKRCPAMHEKMSQRNGFYQSKGSLKKKLCPTADHHLVQRKRATHFVNQFLSLSVVVEQVIRLFSGPDCQSAF